MLRAVSSRACSAANVALRSNMQKTCVVTSVRQAHQEESAEQFDARYQAAFDDPNLDGWMLRKHMNDLQGYDVVPEPKIISAAMKACRRVDDYALAVRYLEAVQDKCGPQVSKIWPYLLQEIKPTLDDLGIDTPQELGYDKPELALKNVYDIH